MEFTPPIEFRSSITGSILVVEDDEDDQFILNQIFTELQISHLVKYFINPVKAIDYLLKETEHPFLILSDINLPIMNGMDFKRKLDQDPILRKKSIPFVFMSTTSNKKIVAQAYQEFTIQGYFQKSDSYEMIRETIYCILSYWQACVHPSKVSQ